MSCHSWILILYCKLTSCGWSCGCPQPFSLQSHNLTFVVLWCCHLNTNTWLKVNFKKPKLDIHKSSWVICKRSPIIAMFSTISRICKWFEPEIVDITVQAVSRFCSQESKYYQLPCELKGGILNINQKKALRDGRWWLFIDKLQWKSLRTLLVQYLRNPDGKIVL